MITEKIFDTGLKHQVACRPGGEGVLACFACGVCTAGCPVSEVEERFNPRRIIHQILIGDRENLLRSKEIWMCIGCYTCTAHCPQDVEFTNLLKVIRSMAVEEGYVPREWSTIIEEIDRRTQGLRRDLIEYLIDTGHTGSPDEFNRFYRLETDKLAWKHSTGDEQ